MYKKYITIKCACINCRKTFKKYKYKQNLRGDWTVIQSEFNCPECGSVLYEAGSAFNAPKERYIKVWEKLKPLFESGFDSTMTSEIQLMNKLKLRPQKKSFRLQSLENQHARDSMTGSN